MITFDFKICKSKCIHLLIFALFSRRKVKSLNEAREMAQPSRALMALAEDPGLVTRTDMVTPNHL